MSRRHDLAQRRAMLVAECSLQRTMLMAQVRQLGFNVSWMSSGQGMLARLKNIPGSTSLGLLLAAALSLAPGKMASLARTAMMLWQLWQKLQSGGDEKNSPNSNSTN